jgi:hypothetical protein
MDPLAYVYSAANALRRNVKDLAANPGDYLMRQADAMKNTYAGQVPVANEREGLGMRQLSPEEQTKAMVEGSLDTIGGPMGGALGVIKPKGGNWLESALRNELLPLRNTKGRISRFEQGSPEEVADQWVDKQLYNYVKNQMGAEDDPIRKLAEQGITHVEPGERLARLDRTVTNARKEAGYPPRGVSKTKMGKEWEKRADSPIAFADAKGALDRLRGNEGKFQYVGKAGDPLHPMANSMVEDIMEASAPRMDIESLTGQARMDAVMEKIRQKKQPTPEEAVQNQFGWIDKAPEGTQLYSFDRNLVSPLENFGQLDKLVKATTEALRSGQITPKQVTSGSHSVENAVRMADVLRKQKLANANSPDVAMDLPDLEQQIVRLNKPGQFAKESDQMGHSVRGYEPDYGAPYGHGGWKGIESGGAEVYSIRDKSGKPGATIEVVKHPDGTRAVTQIKGKFNRAVDPAFQPAISKFLSEGNFLREEANTGNLGIDKSGIFAMGNGDYITKDELAKRVSAGDPDAMDVWQWYIVGPPD